MLPAWTVLQSLRWQAPARRVTRGSCGGRGEERGRGEGDWAPGKEVMGFLGRQIWGAGDKNWVGYGGGALGNGKMGVNGGQEVERACVGAWGHLLNDAKLAMLPMKNKKKPICQTGIFLHTCTKAYWLDHTLSWCTVGSEAPRRRACAPDAGLQ